MNLTKTMEFLVAEIEFAGSSRFDGLKGSLKVGADRAAVAFFKNQVIVYGSDILRRKIVRLRGNRYRLMRLRPLQRVVDLKRARCGEYGDQCRAQNSRACKFSGHRCLSLICVILAPINYYVNIYKCLKMDS